MIARCALCRAFTETRHAPNHPPRIAQHLSAEAATLVGLLELPDDVTPTERDRIGAKFGWCRGSGEVAAPLLVYVAHPVAPPAVVDLDKRQPSALAYNAGVQFEAMRLADHRDIEPAVALNLANADRWYRALLQRFRHLDLIMPWRPMLDHLPDDGPNGPSRAHGLRTAEATAARCDVVLVLVRETSGVTREGRACVGAGGRIVSLAHLGPTPPADDAWPGDDDLPRELTT